MSTITLKPSEDMQRIAEKRRELHKRREAVRKERDKLWIDLHENRAHAESPAVARARELLANKDGAPVKVKRPPERLAELEAELRGFEAAAKLLEADANKATRAALKQHAATVLPEYRQHVQELARALVAAEAANAAIEGIRRAFDIFAGPHSGAAFPYAAFPGRDGLPLEFRRDGQGALLLWFKAAQRDGLLDASDLPEAVRKLL